jgi:hypothetical protein
MMKIIILTVFMSLLLSSCGDNESSSASANRINDLVDKREEVKQERELASQRRARALQSLRNGDSGRNNPDTLRASFKKEH